MCELVPLLQGEVTWVRGRAVPRCCRRTIDTSWRGVGGLEGLPLPPTPAKGWQEREEVRQEVMYETTHFGGGGFEGCVLAQQLSGVGAWDFAQGALGISTPAQNGETPLHLIFTRRKLQAWTSQELLLFTFLQRYFKRIALLTLTGCLITALHRICLLQGRAVLDQASDVTQKLRSPLPLSTTFNTIAASSIK